jgi:hypothetical protein
MFTHRKSEQSSEQSISMSSSDTPYQLQTGAHRGEGTGATGAVLNPSKNPRSVRTLHEYPQDHAGGQEQQHLPTGETEGSLSSAFIIDDFHPLHFKKKLKSQPSVQSSGPGFEFTGPSEHDDDDTASNSSLGSIGWYMTKADRHRLRANKELSDDDKRIVQYLAMRKFHIPGNAYWEDYFYWCVIRDTSTLARLAADCFSVGSRITIPSCAFGSPIPDIRSESGSVFST